MPRKAEQGAARPRSRGQAATGLLFVPSPPGSHTAAPNPHPTPMLAPSRPEWASPSCEASPRSPMTNVTNAQILRASSFALPLMTELQDREPGYQPIHADRLSEQHMIAALACMSSPASC